jgi:two-component system NtrC family sensor kinase
MTNVQNLMAEEADAEKGIALKWIEQETRRIARIVQKLLDFASAQPDAAQGTDLNKVIEDTVTLLRYSLKRHQEITMTTDFEADLPLAAISPDEFKQTMINLLKNAIQAIREKGEIALSTRHHPAEQAIAVTIADNGDGIKEEVIPRIFDPFFTTKANGEGTGLGLSVVYGIIKKYQGKITVTSQEGRGTQIRLAIPVLASR